MFHKIEMLLDNIHIDMLCPVP